MDCTHVTPQNRKCSMHFPVYNPLTIDSNVHDPSGQTNRILYETTLIGISFFSLNEIKIQSNFCPFHPLINSSENNKNANKLFCSTEYTRTFKRHRLEYDDSEVFNIKIISILWDLLYARKGIIFC